MGAYSIQLSRNSWADNAKRCLTPSCVRVIFVFLFVVEKLQSVELQKFQLEYAE